MIRYIDLARSIEQHESDYPELIRGYVRNIIRFNDVKRDAARMLWGPLRQMWVQYRLTTKQALKKGTTRNEARRAGSRHINTQYPKAAREEFFKAKLDFRSGTKEINYSGYQLTRYLELMDTDVHRLYHFITEVNQAKSTILDEDSLRWGSLNPSFVSEVMCFRLLKAGMT